MDRTKLSPGCVVVIDAFDDIPEHLFQIDEVLEDCVTGFALSGPLTGEYQGYVRIYLNVGTDADPVFNGYTHLQVNPGDQLTIIYQSGKWSPGLNETYDALGYGGDPRSANNVIKGVSHAALIGRIGHHQPFFVGEHYHHIVGESGMLYLGINDSDVGNNSGFLQVKVKIEEK